MAANAGTGCAETEHQAWLVSPFTLTSVQEICLVGLCAVSFPMPSRSFKYYFEHLDAPSGSLIFISVHCCLCRALLPLLHSPVWIYQCILETIRALWKAQSGCWHERRHKVLSIQRLIPHLNCVEDNTCVLLAVSFAVSVWFQFSLTFFHSLQKMHKQRLWGTV